MVARTIDKGHGRIETRDLAASSEIADYLDWPGVAQVARIRRTRELAGKTSRETVYVITSLTREQASPEALLALNRQHWSIENTLHWRRDTGFAEDASRIRCGNAPQALASLRNTVLRLLRPFPSQPAPHDRFSPKTDSAPSTSHFRAFFEWPCPSTPRH